MTIYPLTAVRALALRAQGLHTANGAKSTPTRDAIYRAAEQIGCVQIDTLQMVARAHYLTLWSRLGQYNPTDFDALAFDPAERRLFEGWQHAAAYIPASEYRYQMPHQRHLREQPAPMSDKWLAEPGSAELLEQVRERIRQNGGVRGGDFEYNGPKRASWWDWKPAKNALEHLYAWGDLMIADRVNFQRVYDLTGRVLPEWVDTTEPSPEERDRFWVERGGKALGLCTHAQAGDYTWMKLTKAKPIAAALVEEGTLIEVKGKLADGKTGELLIHRGNLSLLEQAASGDIRPQRTTFLNPFDNLFWARRRDAAFWGFEKSFEAYVPAAKRKYGYYCLNILHKDRLVGRFDPKLERQNGTLRLKALYLEPGVQPDEELVSDVAAAMRDFLAFHKANDLVIERSRPEEFGRKLMLVF